jgi:hypothetical protein
MIRRGAEWGTAVGAPVEARVVRSDAELAAALAAGGPVPLVRGGSTPTGDRWSRSPTSSPAVAARWGGGGGRSWR